MNGDDGTARLVGLLFVPLVPIWLESPHDNMRSCSVRITAVL